MAKNTSSKGPRQRPLRVGEMIRRILSQMLTQGDVHDDALASMAISVGEVSMSPDLRVATVFVTPLTGSATPDQAVAALSRNAWDLRKRVAAELNLRAAPELRFRADDTLDRLDAARRMFSDPRVQRDIGPKDDGAEGE